MPRGKDKNQPSPAEKAEEVVGNSAKRKVVVEEQGERESIDRVRDILFGAEMRQHEQKLSHLEELLHKEIANLRDETRNSFNSLENYTKKELETLADQFKAEQRERSESVEELSEKLGNMGKMLEKKLAQLNEKVLENQRDLQEQILQQSKSLMEDIRDKYEKASAALDQSHRELRNDKTDRVALANLFMEVAMRLKEEFKIPDIE